MRKKNDSVKVPLAIPKSCDFFFFLDRSMLVAKQHTYTHASACVHTHTHTHTQKEKVRETLLRFDKIFF